MLFAASTVKGTPSRPFPQTRQEKHAGWKGRPVALRIRSRIGFLHDVHFSRVSWNLENNRLGWNFEARSFRNDCDNYIDVEY